jgi:ketosteroid isomerase-like protein
MKLRLLVISLLITSYLMAQSPDSAFIIRLNQQIDNNVVKRDIAALDTSYADDFVFTHGTGKVDNKQSWLTTVRNAQYPSRQHDSVTVEKHPGLAIVKGRLNIQRIDSAKTLRYHIRYIRVYATRGKRWEMISHSTTLEVHEN